jgi:hypothetical protein
MFLQHFTGALVVWDPAVNENQRERESELRATHAPVPIVVLAHRKLTFDFRF